MPQFNPDPTAASAVLYVPPKGDHTIEIGKPKAFQRTKKAGGESIGVMYPVTFVDGDLKGKRNIFSCYTGSEGGLSYAKRFLMAALGYDLNQDDEDRFNAEFAGHDWKIDTTSGECGDMWHAVVGKQVIATTDVRINEEDDTQNIQWTGFKQAA